MAHRYHLTVRSTDIDVIGHVNNAKYLEYMEWARFEWIWEQGFTLDELRRRAIMPVVVNININYRKELKMREEVTAITTVVKVGEKSFVIRQELYNASEVLVADADVTMVMIDANTRQSISLPAELKEALLVELPKS
ncbi:thioesterase family protein [Brevibacillus formosus]|uniref:acyl-CoA thioesterase n=1 Tax=Brevibacillus TaxID=55080 RepID=UPI000D0EA345|nr:MULTISPECIES: thioesterase family protein [Brevibacillus]MBG9941401.1 4-hydroxybenzoyl-CoA thioesterase [Brevibacillus formosus]MBW5470870.1 YbgC/FadM family acyl-CoA thioesterase [Brevibacillus formosus]MED1948842.1 thioesterase family protein [Brevibacillus formosus]MED2001365.1 thioesterase family protein [Brevibacillus formosus]MED2085450.1 thioesterase family protein [Brevibacillus formosus]